MLRHFIGEGIGNGQGYRHFHIWLFRDKQCYAPKEDLIREILLDL
jgi:hypothetical protein